MAWTREQMKEYQKAYHKVWRHENAEKISSYYKEYYKKNIDHIRELQKKYREERKQKKKI